MTLSNETRHANQRARIIQISTHLISEKGFKGTSLQEIADQVGIHKSTLFHYIKNKEELLLEILKIGISEATDELESIIENKQLSPEEKLRRIIFANVKALAKYKDNVNIYHSEIRFLSKKYQQMYFRMRKHYASLFEKVINEINDSNIGIFEGMNAKVVTLGILGMCNWVVKWFREDGPLSPEEIADTFYRIVRGGGAN